MGGGCRTAAVIGMPYEALKKKKGLSLDRAKGRGGWVLGMDQVRSSQSV